MVQAVLPQAQVMHSVVLNYLEYDALMALFNTLPQYGAVRHLTINSVSETPPRRLEALSRALLDGLRGNGSLVTVALTPRTSICTCWGPALFPETSATYRAMNHYLERNNELPPVLRSQEVRSPLVPSLLSTALEAPMTGISHVAAFLSRYH